MSERAHLFDDWASRVPSHWSRRKLKYVACLRSGESITSDSIAEQGEYPVFGGNGLRGYTSDYTHEGEYVLIGRQGALCGNINYACGRFWASEHAIVVTPRGDYSVKWLGEVLRFMNLNRLSQSAAQPGISADEVGNLFVAVPPTHEQLAIADFLDRETGRIDALVAAKKRLLDLLAEKRKALIAHAVTRGLDPAVPLRDSGVPWLGKIPGHWGLERAKYLFCQSSLPVMPGDEIVTCFRDGRVTLRRNRREEGFTNADLEAGYQGIRPGQLVLHSMDAFAGAIGVSDSSGKCSPEYIVCDPRSFRTFVHFYGPLLRTMALSGFIQASCPAVRERAPRIRFNDFGEMYLPTPPLDEQRAIVDYIARETAKIDAVRAATERSIALLKERRAALIAAAVTGQIDVERAA